MLHQVYSRDGVGSYGGILKKNLTALPETWDAMMDGSQSLDHCMLGHVIEWYYGYVAGIRQAPGSVGWKKVLIGPNPGPLTHAEATLETPMGRLSCRWRKAGGSLRLEAEIPVGVSATAVLPSGQTRPLRAGLNNIEEPAKTAAFPALGTIERLDPRFDQFVPRDAVLEKLAEGFQWSEGPVWIGRPGDALPVRGTPATPAIGPRRAVPPRGYLLFSDIPNNAVMKWAEGEGVSVFLKPSGYTGTTPRGGEVGSNALTLDAAGRLVLCQHGDRRIVRREADGRWTTLVDRYDGKRFNSPNDLVFKSNGDLYFTDPPYGLPNGADDPTRELDFCGVFRVSAHDGKVVLLTRQMTRPNGIAFSPDEKTLYVAQSDPQKAVWMAFAVKKDGTLGPGRVFYDATRWTKTLKGLPDGMKIDKHGNLFAAGPGGVNVFLPDGTLLGRINPDQPTSNCAFGEDGSMLYITANHYLCRIKTSTKGEGF